MCAKYDNIHFTPNRWKVKGKRGFREAAALAAAVGTHGKTCRIVYGTCTGAGKTATVDFKLMVVFDSYVAGNGVGRPNVLLRGSITSVYNGSGLTSLTWTDNSVSWSEYYSDQTSSTANHYVVIGVDE